MATRSLSRILICAAALLGFAVCLAPLASAQTAGLRRARHSTAVGDPASFSAASAAFPAFCKEWEGKLKERSKKNFDDIKWEQREGWETGYYMGYTPILTCETRRSAKGFPVGTLTYREVHYYLVGHTIDEAKQATPQPVAKTETTEMFRWDRDHWSYR